MDTIFALSSGVPPAGIGIIRISGPKAGAVLTALAGRLPVPRRATHMHFRDVTGAPLDDGLALWFPGPKTATGEDLAELHVHGGRAVVAAVLAALGRISGLRPATAGEFTRRAFENGRIDLAQAEGLADLLAAETETQRQSALMLAEGALGALVESWRHDVLRASALVEAVLDFSDEGDVDDSALTLLPQLETLIDQIESMLANPPAERLKDGVRVVFAGPPNSGKSSLFNVLVGRQAAIVADIAGTTRDRIEAPVILGGVPLLLIDTAGLREGAEDPVEAIGIERAGEAMAGADIILWLGAETDAPDGAILIATKSDLATARAGMPVSTVTGAGITELTAELLDQARYLLPKPGSLALNARHRALIAVLLDDLRAAQLSTDALITAEHLRHARRQLDALTGKAGVEDMLDGLFGAFCIGK
jgi:tRNA modification GTPase